MANIFRKRNSLSDDSRGTSTQSIVNHMEREEERSIIGGDKRNSVHSDWCDLISVDEEAEYRKIYKNRKDLTLQVLPLHWLLLLPKPL